jgi:hypothetical protein
MVLAKAETIVIASHTHIRGLVRGCVNGQENVRKIGGRVRM